MIVQENIVGIDIGLEKILMIKASKGSVSKAVSAAIPEGVIKPTGVESKEMLTDFIKKLKKSNRIGDGKCVLCLSGSDSIIRLITVPEMSSEQIYLNVLSEIASFLPVNPDRFIIDYRVQEIIKAEPAQYKIMVVASPREYVITFIDC